MNGSASGILTVLHLVTLRPLTLLVVQSFRVVAGFLTTTTLRLAFLTVAASACPICAAPNGTATGTSAASGNASAINARFELLLKNLAAILQIPNPRALPQREGYASRALAEK